MQENLNETSSQESVEAAMALVAEHPLLKKDPIIMRAIKDGIGANGKPIKRLGEFVESRGAFLELEEARKKLRGVNPEILDAIVVHSVRPDLERYIN
jgi:hypothetical protein